jgi:hypothetical protein
MESEHQAVFAQKEVTILAVCIQLLSYIDSRYGKRTPTSELGSGA